MRKKFVFCLLGMVIGAGIVVAQNATRKVTGAGQKPQATGQKRARTPRPKLSPQRQFVLDVVRSAVALPQADPQDRLRVLTTATTVVGPVSGAFAKRYAREGAHIEAELIAREQKPVVSILSAGHFDCRGAASFIDQIPATGVVDAEQSLISLMAVCQRQATEGVRRKMEAALSQGILAPRALLALMEATGAKSAWSQANFGKMFHTLPSDPEKVRQEAPNYAAMFNRMAPEVDKDLARDAGLRFLEWLAKLSDGGAKNIAVNMTADSLKQALGDEDYQSALRSNLVVRDVVNSTQGKPAEVEHPAEENVSVLAAMGEVGQDRTDDISKLPPSMRAREAAAHGYATGVAGDPKSADRYFDIAFSALDEVWSNRNEQKDAPAVIQEVSEAAAQVNAVSALKRAQALGDSSSQAIGMLAVARVVLGQAQVDTVHPPRSAMTSSRTN